MSRIIAVARTKGGGRISRLQLPGAHSHQVQATEFEPTFVTDGRRPVVCADRGDTGLVAYLEPDLALTPIADLAGSTAHVSLTGSLVAVAQYHDSRVWIHDAMSGRATAVTFAGSGPHPRQDRSHPHSTLFCKGCLLVADHGADAVHVVVHSAAGGWRHVTSWTAPAGSGPRDLIWHGGRVWLSTELGGSLHQLQLVGEKLVEVATPQQVGRSGENLMAGLVADPQRDRIYIGDRLDKSIAIVGTGGTAALVGRIPAYGWPRHLALSPDHRHLAAALEDTGRIQVIELDNEASSRSLNVGGSPQAVTFLDAPDPVEEQ